MKNAINTPLPGRVELNEQIQVHKKVDRKIHGSCNACTSFTQLIEYDTVTEVHLRGMSFRLCPACRKTLKGLL